MKGMTKDKSVKYLVYADILGFEELAKEVAGGTGVDEDSVRENYLSNPLKDKIDEIKKYKETEVCTGRDDYLLFIDNFQKTLEVINALASIKIPIKNYENIPVEIAVGVKEFNECDYIKNSINKTKTIEFLKDDIVSPYKKKYREEHDGESVKETFIVLTGDVFGELEGVDKKYCEEISYEGTRFYYLPNSIIEREAKISNFLQKIGQSRSDYSGALIDRIFVPPDEYHEIKKKLKKDRIVFMTGTAGYGKTYTAIRLLWEWYNEGYTPRWISGKEEQDRKKVREKLANIDAELKPEHIIYFEDPFGKTKYERRDDLKERINHIINSVQNKKDVFVVITSRKDVFEEFEKECYSVEEIKEFEKELNILKPSYDYKKRKEILEKWAEEKGCEWFGDENLKKVVFDSLKNKGTLATPLSIHDFVGATIKIENEKELRQEIDRYSQGVEIAFADEIKGLYDSGRKDRVLFLSFIFVSEYFEVDFVEKEYEKLKGENFEDFERILKEEYRVKIVEEGFEEPLMDIYEDEQGNIVMDEKGYEWRVYREMLMFSHPSYPNALTHMLEHSGCRNIFCKVLKELANKKDDITISAVACSIVKKINKLPRDTQKIMFKIANTRTGAFHVVSAIRENFNTLPENVRNDLLLKIADKEGTVSTFAQIITENFNNLPEEIQNLIYRDNLQKELKELVEFYLFLANEEGWARKFLKFIKDEKFKQEILTKLSKDEDKSVRQKALSS